MDKKKSDIQEKVKKEKAEYNVFLTISVIFFIIVAGATGYLYFSNKDLGNKIEETNTTISLSEKEIVSLKESKEIAVYDIISNNKDKIDNVIESSRASKYINELINVSKEYKMIFSGFSFSDNQITTNAAYINKERGGDSIEGVTQFIKDFRDWEGKEDEKKPIISLNPVSSVSGDNKARTFSLSFTTSK